MSSPELIERLSAAVADGRRVDWEAELRAHPDSAPVLRRLRLVERLGTAQRPAVDDTAFDVIGTTTLPHTPPDSKSTALRAPMPASWGSLRLLATLGTGGFGEVYRAFDPALEREVALKLRRPTQVDRSRDDEKFLQEARRLARVRHANVLTVHGADRHDGRVGLWTDLLEGRTLEQELEQRGPFAAEEAVLVGIDLCRALAAVHGAGLVHRDVKTANVMRERGGRIVLMDFGSVTERADLELRGASEAVSGTPLFMAPELLRGEDSGPAGDVYSLGVVLYRLVTARFPIEARTLPELYERVCAGAAVPLTDVRPDLPAAFVRVVERALATEPARRFASAGELERALRICLGEIRPEPVPKPPPVSRRFVLAAVTVGVMAAALWLLIGRDASPLEPSAALYRVREGREEPLGETTPLRLGDGLVLSIENRDPLHVYVLDEDDQGNAFVLFPLAGLDLENPLPGRVRHRLPGSVSGSPRRWNVDRAAGHETLLVVASRSPIAFLENEVSRLPAPGSQRPRFRGLGDLVPDDAVPRRGSTVARVLGELEGLAPDEVFTLTVRVPHEGTRVP